MLYQTILPNLISDYNFVLYHSGDHRNHPSFSIVNIAEQNLSRFMPKSLIKKFSYVLLEAIQNIERYSQHLDHSEDFSLVFCDADVFHIITRNLVKNEEVNELEERLDNINSRHIEELNRLFIECSRSDEFTRKGAGLGLIDIARKSKRPLHFSFTKRSETHSAYTLHIKIPITEAADNEMAEKNAIVLSRTLFSSFSQNKSTLFYCGDFSNSFLLALLDMLKNVKKNEKLSSDSKLHHVLIELTQNMKRHAQAIGENIPGYLCIEWDKDNIGLSTYNLINSDNKKELGKKIDLINKASDDELKELSRKHLSDFQISGGLGLIDIALLTRPNKFTFNLSKNPKLDSYFYLKTHLSHD